METIDITIKKQKPNTFSRITTVFYLLHFLIFLIAYLFGKATLWPLLIVSLIIVFQFILPKLKPLSFIKKEYFYILLMLIWFIVNIYWMAFLCAILFTFSRLLNSKTIFSFSEDQIVRNSFMVKKYQWEEFVNIIIKDNFLTLDFKNNRILQAEIEEHGLNEEYFNKFAAYNIRQHAD